VINSLAGLRVGYALTLRVKPIHYSLCSALLKRIQTLPLRQRFCLLLTD